MPSASPLVSVLIANYNNGNYLEDAIKSVNNQTYSNWEIIIVDDASSDNSWDIIQKCAKAQPKIHYYQNFENLKVGATKARATNLANGEICAILDPDDALAPTAIEKHVAVYLKNPGCSLVGSNYYECNESLKITSVNKGIFQPENAHSYLASKGGIHHFWSFNKAKYNLTTGFDAFFVLAEDQDVFYKLEEVGSIKIINEPLYYYRIHAGAISQGDKVAMAYAYHLMAKFNALKRRTKHTAEIQCVKEAVLKFIDWGILKTEKSIRSNVIRQAILKFPDVMLQRKMWSIIYHTIK